MTYIFLSPRILSGCMLGIHRNFQSACLENMPIQTLELGDSAESMNYAFGEVTSKSSFAELQDGLL